VAGLVAVQPHVPLDPGGSSRVELLHLHLEVRRVLRPGIRLHQPGRVPAMITAGSGDLQGDAQVVPGMLEPFGHHPPEVDRDPATPSRVRPGMLRRQRRTQQRPPRLRPAAQDPLQRDRHWTAGVAAVQALDRLAVLRHLRIHAPGPQRQFRPGHAVLDHLVGELEVQHVQATLRVPQPLICKKAAR